LRIPKIIGDDIVETVLYCLVNKSAGFRRSLSCETQLLTFIQEMHDNLHKGYQTDLIIFMEQSCLRVSGQDNEKAD